MKTLLPLLLAVLSVSASRPELTGRPKIPQENGANIQLWTCNGGPNQQWIFPPNNQKLIILKSTNQCLDIEAYSTADGANVHLWDCHQGDTDPNHQNQEWTYTSAENVVAQMSGKCLDVYNSGKDDGSNVQIWACANPPQTNQQWVYNSTDSTVRGVGSGKCLDAGTTAPPVCTAPPTSTMPFCNYSLPVDQRVNNLLSQLSIDEKVGLLGSGSHGVPRLGIAAYQWECEGLHGVALSVGVQFSDPTPVATMFPQVIGTAASFDVPLFKKIGQIISNEARAFANVGHSGLTYWTPNINIFRDPRWGRGQETPGEDPYLSSQYAVNFVNGIQQGTDPNYLKISACCKHFAAYSLENWNGMDRDHFNGNVTAQDFADTYLPQFQACVQQAKGSIMCSYNANNGVPSCADHTLLTDDLRTAWGFNMYVTGDCGAVDDVQNTHHYTSNPADTCAAVLKAGMNIDCGNFLQGNMNQALSSGKLTEADLNKALYDPISVQMRLGMFDPKSIQPYTTIPVSAINTADSQATSLQAAKEGAVLLKNNNKALPFSRNTVKTIAAVGPNADNQNTLKGNYEGVPPFLITPRVALQSYANVTYAQGCAIASSDTSGFTAAVNAAKAADATVIVIGLDGSQENEGHDRTAITLPGVQSNFISTVASSAKGPVVVVIMSGSSVDITALLSSNDVDAILWAGYGGQAGGTAIAQVIFGDYNPSGRLPFSFYTANYINELNMLDMHMRPQSGNAGRTYRFYTGKPIFEFGYGLSYTNFTYSWSTFPDLIAQRSIEKVLAEAGTNSEYYNEPEHVLATVTCKVTNTGSVAGDDAVLYLVVPPNAGQNGVPLKYLAGFQRVTLAAGGSTTVTFTVSAKDLAVAGNDGKLRTTRGEWIIQIGVGDNQIQRAVTVLGESQIQI